MAALEYAGGWERTLPKAKTAFEEAAWRCCHLDTSA